MSDRNKASGTRQKNSQLTHALLGGGPVGNDLDELQTRGLGNLIVNSADICAGIGCADVDLEVSNLPVEACGVDIPLHG